MSKDRAYSARWITQCAGPCRQPIPPDTEIGFLPTLDGEKIACTTCCDNAEPAERETHA